MAAAQAPRNRRPRRYVAEIIPVNVELEWVFALAAEHSFARYFQSGNAKLIGLHFEHLRCGDRAAVCKAAGCLHQVYISTGGKYRLLKSSYVPELDLTQVKVPAGR
jgi:hypothetical protein